MARSLVPPPFFLLVLLGRCSRLLATKPITKSLSGARQAGANRTDWHIKDLRDLFVSEPIEPHEQHDLTLFLRHPRHSLI